jgi:chloride channel protein, CIC family
MLTALEYPVLFLKNRLSDRNFIIVSSILVGLTSGFAAIVLKYAVHAMGKLVVVAQVSGEFILIAAMPLAGILLAVFFVRFFLNGQLKRGSAEIVYSIVKRSSLIRLREAYGHLLTSAFTVGMGGSLGLESPMVSTGSSIGSNFGKNYGLSYKERTILLGCGASAGIAAAFNSPIAGVLFAIEVLLTDVTTAAFIPLIVSAASGALVSKIVLAEGVTLAFKLQQPFNYLNVPYYVLLGILCGLISLVYRKVFNGIELRFEAIKNIWVRVFAGGIILFAIILIFPPLFGEGYEGVRLLELKNPEKLVNGSLIERFIQTDGAMLAFIALLILFKMIAAAITLGSGGNGGSFAPSLVIGSYLGFVFSRLTNLTGIAQLPVSNFTLVSMAGILSGIFYAPLTAIFLIAEITGGYGLIIPLMIVSSLSLVVVLLFQPLSMEAKKLSLMLKSTVETRDKLLLSRLDLSDLIETNFAVVDSNASLKDLTNQISASNRNLFPVLDKDCKLVGIVSLDKIRKVMFDQSKYETLGVKDLMEKPKAVVELTENLHEVLAKFDLTGEWNLPVIENDCYVGFLSKSTILTRYRKELLDVGS